ncbi:hypothetical protein AXF42_Ash013371 [Apostasia shenzhenica]|uniref:Uncharacterized protein n=1 Tax=Apostasia shenzhenica TaxID=1088818 RepID=A0A2I0A402_9ASPA|nr:hypothetical protein AXF42_Ash013371 [Apostasia shenzhenica]
MASQERWTGVLKVPVKTSNIGSFFKVAASLILSSSSKTLAIPTANAVFFKGDRVEGTGNPVIERLSDSRNIADLLVSKLGESVNAWVVEASTFNGPFAVYREFILIANSCGEPERYDPDGFPASSSIVSLISKSIDQVKNATMDIHSKASSSSPSSSPETILLGFSKGGTVINQIVAELAHLPGINDNKLRPQTSYKTKDGIFPASIDSFLLSISNFHYVDVGLNSHGAYLTDQIVIDKIARNAAARNSRLNFVFHGTPRQWFDRNRPWIRREKDVMRQLLQDVAQKYGSSVLELEHLYYADKHSNLQMHFEIIDIMNLI